MAKKTKFKVLLSLVLIVLLASTVCYATETSDAILDGVDSAQPLTTGTDETPTTTDATDATDATAAADTTNWTNSDYYACDEKVVIDGVIDGNAFVIGKEVTVKGEIGGDLFVMAEKLNIDGGYIYSSVFALAQDITMNGISYDFYALASSFNLDTNGFIYRDMRVAASDVTLAGRIRRDAYIEANSLKFDETVGTIIYGNLNYSSSASEYAAPEGAVAGEVKYSQDAVESTEVDAEKVAKVSVWAVVLKHVRDLITALVTTLLVALFLVFAAPKFLEKLGKISVGKAFGSLGIGLVAPFALAIVAIVLLIVTGIIQVIGLGLSVCASAFFVFITLSVVASAVASTYFGKLFAKLIKKDGKLFTILFALLVDLVLWVIGLIPLLGGLVGFLVWAFAIGTILLNLLPSKKAKAE